MLSACGMVFADRLNSQRYFVVNTVLSDHCGASEEPTDDHWQSLPSQPMLNIFTHTD